MWVDKCPLKILFPDLYAVDSQQNATFRDIYQEGAWELSFRRNLNEEGRAQLIELLSKNPGCGPEWGGGHYKVVWPHTKKKQFTSRLMYRLLTFGGVVDSDMQGIRRSKVPLKIKHFVYHVGRGGFLVPFSWLRGTGREERINASCVGFLKLLIMSCSIALLQNLLGVWSRKFCTSLQSLSLSGKA